MPKYKHIETGVVEIDTLIKWNEKKRRKKITWYKEQLKQCQQQLSPSTYRFAWPLSHGKLHTDSGGFGWLNLNCTSVEYDDDDDVHDESRWRWYKINAVLIQ